MLQALANNLSALSVSRGDFVVPHVRTAIKQHSAFSIVGPSAWNSLQLNSAHFHWICPACFSSSLKLLFSPGPGLGAPVSRDVPDIHPVPGKCRISHYSVLPGPGKIMGPSNKKNFFFLPKVLMISQ